MSEKPGTNRKSIGINSLLDELAKRHMTLDGSNRITHLYEAPTDTLHGDPCICTRFQYSGVTAYITGSKEEEATWDSSWDF